MPGLNPDPQTPAENRENWRILIETSEHLYNRYWLDAGGASPVAAAAPVVVGPAGHTLPGIVLPDAATTNARWALPIRLRHIKATLRLTFYYTSPTGGTANFNLTWRIRAHNPSGPLATNVLAGTSSATYPGPAVANDVLSGVVLFSTAYSSLAQVLLSVMLSRDGATDANNFDFHYISGVLEVLPA